jgi:hypothetical protein
LACDQSTQTVARCAQSAKARSAQNDEIKIFSAFSDQK